jgi:alkylated DNA nucleotide flippase Atl1
MTWRRGAKRDARGLYRFLPTDFCGMTDRGWFRVVDRRGRLGGTQVQLEKERDIKEIFA